MAIWQTAQTRVDKAAPGWLARAIDGRGASASGSGKGSGSSSGGDAPGLHIHESFPLPQALAGGHQVVPSLARLEQFRRRLGMPAGSEAAAQIDALDLLAHQDRGEPGSLLQFVERCSVITYASSARLERVQQGAAAAGDGYPEFYGLARRLKLIAQLVKAGLSTPIYYTHLDGFDTHSGQLATHASLLRELGTSLEAFLTDLEKSGEADRVLVLVFSEFGRRLGENASGGTDHGTAAPVFLLGRPVHPGLHGKYPDLTHLEDGDPIHSVRLPPGLRHPARPLARGAAPGCPGAASSRWACWHETPGCPGRQLHHPGPARALECPRRRARRGSRRPEVEISARLPAGRPSAGSGIIRQITPGSPSPWPPRTEGEACS